MLHGPPNAIPRHIQRGNSRPIWFRRHVPSRHPQCRTLIPANQPFTEAEDKLIIRLRGNGNTPYRVIAETLDRTLHSVYLRYRGHLIPAVSRLLVTEERRPYSEWENTLIIDRRKEGEPFSSIAAELSKSGRQRSKNTTYSHFMRHLIKYHPELLSNVKYEPQFCAIVKQALKSGKTMRQIQRETGRSEAEICKHAYLVSEALPISHMTTEEINRIIRLRGLGKSWTEISEKVRRPVNMVKRTYYYQREKWEATGNEIELIRKMNEAGSATTEVADSVDLPIWLVRREIERIRRRRNQTDPSPASKHYRRWTDADYEKLLKLHQEGLSVTEMGLQLGTSSKMVYKLLGRLAEIHPHVEGLPRKTHRRYTLKEMKKMMHLREEQRLTWNEVAEHFPGTTGKMLCLSFNLWRAKCVIPAKERSSPEEPIEERGLEGDEDDEIESDEAARKPE